MSAEARRYYAGTQPKENELLIDAIGKWLLVATDKLGDLVYDGARIFKEEAYPSGSIDVIRQRELKAEAVRIKQASPTDNPIEKVILMMSNVVVKADIGNLHNLSRGATIFRRETDYGSGNIDPVKEKFLGVEKPEGMGLGDGPFEKCFLKIGEGIDAIAIKTEKAVSGLFGKIKGFFGRHR